MNRLQDLYTKIWRRNKAAGDQMAAYPANLHSVSAGAQLQQLEPRLMLSAAITPIAEPLQQTAAAEIQITAPTDTPASESQQLAPLTNIISPSVLSYSENRDGTLTITDCPYTAIGKLVIPATINGKTITAIGPHAFDTCYRLTRVEIPDTVKTIADAAFIYCFDLTDAILGNGVKTIGDAAFYNCESLTVTNIPIHVQSIGDAAFEGCALTSIDIPESVTNIGSSAFSWCPLTSIDIPDSVRTIKNDTFANCRSLESVNIGNGVTTIETYAFCCCTYLTNLTIGKKVTTIEADAFDGCSSLISIDVSPQNTSYTSIDGVLFSHDMTTLVMCPARKTGTYIIPDGVTTIENSAFSSSDLTTIEMPDSVETIGECAFAVSELTSITLGDGVTTIGDYAFVGCWLLTGVTLGDNVTSIGTWAFETCASLTDIDIPASVTNIGTNAFGGCHSLTSVTFRGDAPASFGGSVFFAVGDGFTVHFYEGASGFSTPTWQGYNCQMLESPFPNTPTGITASRRTYMDKVLITWNEASGASEYELWRGTSNNVSSASLLADNITTTSYEDTSAETEIEYYYWVKAKNSAGTSEFSSYRRGIRADLFRYTVKSDETITIVSCYKGITGHLAIPETLDGKTVTIIQSYSISGCNLLTSVDIPDSVIKIGDVTFANCESLTSVTIGNSVTTIGDYAFRFCPALTNVTIGDSVTTIEIDAFSECDSLASINIPDKVTTIKDGAFSDCKSLASVTFEGDAPVSLSENTFQNIASDFTFYFHEGASGFTTPTWQGHPCEMIPSATNSAPELAAIGNQSLSEGQTLTFTAAASDSDNDTLTFSLTGDVPAGAAIDASSGAFHWSPTQAQIPSEYTFSVEVSDGELTGIEEITITVAAVNDEGNSAELNNINKWKLQYTDIDGDIVTVRLKGPKKRSDLTAELGFDGNWAGDDPVQLLWIHLHGDTTEKMSLSITVKKNRNGGDGETALGNIDLGSGSLKYIAAKTVDLTGEITTTGYVGSIQLDDLLDGAAIDITGDTPNGINLKADEIGNVDMNLGDIFVRSITATSWTDGQLDAGYIQSLCINGNKRANLAGDFGADVNLTDMDSKKSIALNRMRVAGTMTSNINAATDSAAISNITAGAWDSGSLSATYVNSVTVKGNKNFGIAGDLGADLTLTGTDPRKGISLTKLSVAATMDSVDIITAGSIGSVKLGGIANSSIAAGLTSGMSIADDADDFENTDAMIKSVNIRGLRGESGPFFTDSSISAAKIGNINFVDAAEDTMAATTSGICSLTGGIKQIRYKDNADKNNSWNYTSRQNEGTTGPWDQLIKLFV